MRGNTETDIQIGLGDVDLMQVTRVRAKLRNCDLQTRQFLDQLIN